MRVQRLVQSLVIGSVTASAIGVATAHAQTAKPTFDLSIKNIMRGPEVYGREPQQVRWSPDGQWIYFQWLPPGSDWRDQPKPYRVRLQAGAQPERVADAGRMIFNDRLDAAVAAFFLVSVIVILAASAREWLAVINGAKEANST